MSSFTKCTVQKGGYSSEQCDAMKRCVTLNTRSKAKGLFFSQVVNIETGEKRGIGITIKSEQIPRGVYLNFCPFCGGELRDTSEDEKEQP